MMNLRCACYMILNEMRKEEMETHLITVSLSLTMLAVCMV